MQKEWSRDDSVRPEKWCGVFEKKEGAEGGRAKKKLKCVPGSRAPRIMADEYAAG